MARLLISLVIGFLVTVAFFFATWPAMSYGQFSLAKALFWQEPLLQSLPTWHAIVSPESPLFSSLTFLGAFPLGTLVYGAAAYVWLRRRAPNNSFKPKPLRGSA